MFALGSAIYEITEWSVPYGAETNDGDVDKALGRGEWPVLSTGNPAADIIRKFWSFEYSSAREVMNALR